MDKKKKFAGGRMNKWKETQTNGISLHKVKPITAGYWQTFQLLWLLLEATKLCSLKQETHQQQQTISKKKKEEWVTPNKLICFYSAHGRSGYIVRHLEHLFWASDPYGLTFYPRKI